MLCEKKESLIRKGLLRNQQPRVFMSNVHKLIDLLVNSKTTTEEIMKSVDKWIADYDPAWYQLEAQLPAMQEQDRFLYERFVNWWMRDVRPLAKSFKRYVRWEAFGRKGTIDCMCQYTDGRVEAFLIRRKNFEQVSARSRKNPMEFDMDAIGALCFLAKNGCEKGDVTLVFLEGDARNPAFVVEDGQPKSNANVMRYRYLEFRNPDGSLSLEKLEKGYRVAEDALEKNAEPPYCAACSLYDMCKVKVFSEEYLQSTLTEKNAANSHYKLPTFTPIQKQAVAATEGPVILSCGPGSGKTAVLVGRTLHLLKNGVSPTAILLVTFTNKAAGELKERIASYLSDGGQLPIVSTLNALGYDILLRNAESLGFEPKVATDMEKMQIAMQVLSEMPPIRGLNYDRLSGRGGLIARFVEMCEQYHLDAERFENDPQRADIDLKAFAEAYERFSEATQNFITFDDQIQMCLKLFEDHPNILQRYQRQFEYIMVDEFQDVSGDCAKFVYLLAAKNRNLCVVGDDDQSIYAFNGGSNRYLLAFVREWGAKQIVIDENFRSTQEILSMADAVISKSTEERIAKKLTASRKGTHPIFQEGCTLLDLNSTIRQLQSKGLALNEIAIIARTNDALESLHQALEVPTQIAKAYSCADPIYGILRDIYSMYYHGLSAQLLYHMAVTIAPDQAFELPIDQGENFLTAMDRYCGGILDKNHVLELDGSEDPLITCVQVLYRSFWILDAGTTSISAIRRILGLMGLESHIILQDISEAVEKKAALQENAEMEKYLSSVLMFAQTSRMETKEADAVQLVTAHDSKGLEWRAVIIWEVESFRVHSRSRTYKESDYTLFSEYRRLLYVAMTRAKEYLYFMQTKPATGLNFIGELRSLTSQEKDEE